MIKVAIIGTVGVPANYGGFETLVENIINYSCPEDIEYIIYCSAKSYNQKLKYYKGAKLEYIHLKANGIQSILYDIISIVKAIRKANVLLILGVSGCLILPLIRLFSHKKIIVNIDGLEHQRNKWNKSIQKFLKFSEKVAVKNADIIIADNKVIQEYITKEYGKNSELIAYGGDHVQCDISQIVTNTMETYSLKKGEYSFALCRIEPENNIHIILEAFAQSGLNLVFVGNWKNSTYGKKLLESYKETGNLKMLDPIYEIPTLNIMRANCSFYLHGHSAGGTNPSLVEAMFFAKPILAFDCPYNRESTEYKANYFANTDELIKLIKIPSEQYQENAQAMLEIAQRRYRWQTIAKQYENLYR